MRSQTLRENGLAEPGWASALKPVHSVHGRLLSAVISELPNLPPTLLPTTSKSLARRLAYVLIAPNSPNEPLVEDGDLACQNILQMSLPAAVSSHSNFLLYNILPRALSFVRKHLTAGEDVCVACPTGKDLGPGVIVTALSLFFSDDGDLLCDDDVDDKGEPAGEGLRRLSIERSQGLTIDKSTIRKRLQWIISSNPKVNPSRNTLKRVNEFLMSHLHHPHYVSPSSTPQTNF
jgi:tRNA A64-2'-O-ribosylphosphate transferase